jgi:hypothetical protein
MEGQNFTPATPQPEPAGAGVDLEALALFLEDRSMSLNCGLCSDKAEEIWKALRSPASPPRDLEAVQAIDRALDEVCRINNERWKGEKGWRMSIPADPKRDSDLIIADALQLARTAIMRAHPPEETPAPGTAGLEEKLARLIAPWFGFSPENEWKRCTGNAAEIIAALRTTPGSAIEAAAREVVAAYNTRTDVHVVDWASKTGMAIERLETALSGLPQEHDEEGGVHARPIPQAARIKLEEAQAYFHGGQNIHIAPADQLKVWDCLVMAKSFLGDVASPRPDLREAVAQLLLDMAREYDGLRGGKPRPPIPLDTIHSTSANLYRTKADRILALILSTPSELANPQEGAKS